MDGAICSLHPCTKHGFQMCLPHVTDEDGGGTFSSLDLSKLDVVLKGLVMHVLEYHFPNNSGTCSTPFLIFHHMHP